MKNLEWIKKEEWNEEKHKYHWFEPLDWDEFVKFIGGNPDNPIWPGEDSDRDHLKNEPGKTSGRKWQDWWKFYWAWQIQYNNKKLPDNLSAWAMPIDNNLTTEDIMYWMKHWKSYVSRHWKAWEKHGKPRPTNEHSSIEYNSLIAWGADPENPPFYVKQD
ncbi:MAG: hypothetical protein A2287_04280 [Candidatus Melainabacteria bacterium RIFOXYA12_FULL_32_12]|nr:MAG: hypothetical protein A2255_08215 [Candidatus Melainabacteria bacterium RIFOXYA2_FULL_32_9]OGI30621.1 MAG: hypothetical protein A2287_04280 [Candidatus Melainabacteria bacterium RIFOXYA12_FULL_32_12]